MGYLQVRSLCKKFGTVQAVDDVSFDIEKGGFLALLGPSGCGKTTTLRIIAGLTHPDSGKVILDGSDLTLLSPEKRRVGMVFQTWALFPHMTVYENIAFGLRSQRIPKTEIQKRVQEALELVQLPGIEDRMPRQLSGGQQQRVSLTRALVARPKLMLFDEPLSNLDHKLRVQMRTELKNLQRSLSLTCIHVTHDQGEALSLGDQVAVMSSGRILDLRDSRQLFDYPKTRFVADFLGATNILQGSLMTEASVAKFYADSGLVFEVASVPRQTVDDIRYAAIRPEKIHLIQESQGFRGSNAFPVIIQGVDYLGTEIRYIVELTEFPGMTLTVSESSGLELDLGAKALAEWNPTDVLLLQEDPKGSDGGG